MFCVRRNTFFSILRLTTTHKAFFQAKFFLKPHADIIAIHFYLLSTKRISENSSKFTAPTKVHSRDPEFFRHFEGDDFEECSCKKTTFTIFILKAVTHFQ